MKLTRVELKGVRNLPNLELPLVSPGDEPFVVTGPAGSGKTSFLEAIAAAKEASAPYGLAPDAASFRSRTRHDGHLAIDWQLAPDERKAVGARGDTVATRWSLADGPPQQLLDPDLRAFLGGYSKRSDRFKVEYFHAGRASGWDTLEAPIGSDVAEGGRRLTRHPRKYAWVRTFLEQSGQADAQGFADDVRQYGVAMSGTVQGRLDGFGKSLATLTGRLRWVGLRRQVDRVRCVFARKGDGEVELEGLTDSERVFVLFAATFEALGLRRSLILIDLPEIAVHPEDQAAFFQGLAALAREGQIIAATTSPAILRNVPRERVLVLGGA